jgi:hypothetical protein
MIGVRVTDSERTLFRAMAGSVGLSQTSLFRTWLRREAENIVQNKTLVLEQSGDSE